MKLSLRLKKLLPPEENTSKQRKTLTITPGERGREYLKAMT